MALSPCLSDGFLKHVAIMKDDGTNWFLSVLLMPKMYVFYSMTERALLVGRMMANGFSMSLQDDL